ncbi:hypothetical protein C0J52_05255 [Blattella germanica]|nr:hypothetical protein C0J52_05255 [Blattella germanica]
MKEPPDRVHVSSAGGEVQRRRTIAVAKIRVHSLFLDHPLEARQTSHLGGGVHRRHPVFGANVQRTTRLRHQELEYLEVALLSCQITQKKVLPHEKLPPSQRHLERTSQISSEYEDVGTYMGKLPQSQDSSTSYSDETTPKKFAIQKLINSITTPVENEYEKLTQQYDTILISLSLCLLQGHAQHEIKTQKKFFDIATCKYKDFSLCNCQEPLKVPIKERKFLQDQGTKRKMGTGNVDIKTMKENQNKLKRKDKSGYIKEHAVDELAPQKYKRSG